jgi:hypothetical protein
MWVNKYVISIDVSQPSEIEESFTVATKFGLYWFLPNKLYSCKFVSLGFMQKLVHNFKGCSARMARPESAGISGYSEFLQLSQPGCRGA